VVTLRPLKKREERMRKKIFRSYQNWIFLLKVTQIKVKKWVVEVVMVA
jgi:hypothetical protein